jgi:hypothetical protein
MTHISKLPPVALILVTSVIASILPAVFSSEARAFQQNDADDQSKFLCSQAQALVGGYELPKIQDHLVVTLFQDLNDFINSKPAIGNDQVTIDAIHIDAAQSAQGYSNLWCKLKSREALAASRNLPSFPPSEGGVGCEGVQEAIFSAMIANEPTTREQYLASGYEVEFRNILFRTGREWAPSSTAVDISNQKVTITTASLESARGLPVIGGMHYCKLVDTDGLRKVIRELRGN